MMKPNKNITVWCDMDGVLAIYEPESYTGDHPRYLIPNEHYFATCLPDERIIKVLQHLTNIYHVKLNVISNVHPTMKQEHSIDKRNWLRTHMSFLDTGMHYYPVLVPKYEYVETKLHRSLRPTDILISDFNRDLEPWLAHGGTAIKYINQINNPDSFKGPCISTDLSVKRITNYLIDMITDISNPSERE